MRTLIIGARGFIGSHLKEFMIGFGDVLAVSLSSLKGHERRQRLVEIFASAQPDVCINCSGAAHVQSSFGDPLNDFEMNTTVVFEILAAIRQVSPGTRFVHLSSAAVYGNPVTLPILESSPLTPVSPYGYHKLAAEQICQEFSDIYDIRTISLRIFSAYGPGLRKQLLWDVYRKWCNYNDLELFGSGEEKRDFIFIDDVCEAIARVVERAPFRGERVNVGSGEAVSVREIVTLLLHELGGSRRATFAGRKREGDPDWWCADVSMLKSLGFEAKTSIENGIKATAQWLKEQG